MEKQSSYNSAEIFEAAIACTTLGSLKEKTKALDEELKLFKEKYPKLPFTISVEDLDAEEKLDKKNYNLILKNQQFTALEKVLVSILWKNGMLNRLPSFIAGVRNEKREKDTGQIFFQFGRHMVDNNEPIVDVNCLNAYAHYVSKVVKLPSAIAKNKLIPDYINWFKNIVAKSDEKDRTAFSCRLDKMIFLLGKDLKENKTSSTE